MSSPDTLERDLERILEAYKDELVGTIAYDFEQAGLVAEEEAKRQAPVETGTYRAGWGFNVEQDSYGGVRVTVGNTAGGRKGGRKRKLPTNITSLLEKGHMTVNGKWVRAEPHIEPAYEYAIAYLKARLGFV